MAKMVNGLFPPCFALNSGKISEIAEDSISQCCALHKMMALLSAANGRSTCFKNTSKRRSDSISSWSPWKACFQPETF
jgi:hypothetical protein